ncbi:MAG: hypothetical protein QOF42_1533, partial [Gammaproteobacteria bacterium]|nr:hypothetical protein [Gammaproteobacteria bacterium]
IGVGRRNFVHRSRHTLYDIVDISEVALVIAAVEDIDQRAS